jgi:SAM-dependent methyltransferase
MSKRAEQEYLSNIGEGGQQHALNKPFSDAGCGENLVGIGVIMQLLPEPPARILDLGCGTGWTSALFALRGYDVIGHDIAPDMLALARENKKRYAAASLDFVEGDYEQLPFENEFDAAIFYDSLHHCEDEETALRMVYRALKPGGILITHEPGEGHSINPHSIRAMQLYGVNERDMPPWLIMKAGRKAGFRESSVLPMPATLHEIFYRVDAAARKGRLGILRRLKLAQPLRIFRMGLHARKLGSIVVLRK